MEGLTEEMDKDLPLNLQIAIHRATPIIKAVDLNRLKLIPSYIIN
jgi:hypothetical protein